MDQADEQAEKILRSRAEFALDRIRAKDDIRVVLMGLYLRGAMDMKEAMRLAELKGKT